MGVVGGALVSRRSPRLPRLRTALYSAAGGRSFEHSPLALRPCHRYFTFGAATAMLVIGLPARPDTSLSRWADRQAAEKLGDA